MALLRVFFSSVRSFSGRRSPLSRQWQKGLLSLRTLGRYLSPAASPVTFKAAKCMRSCRSINQKQLLSWGQSCSRASRTRTSNASSGSSSRNSLRTLTASLSQLVFDEHAVLVFHLVLVRTAYADNRIQKFVCRC